LILFIVHCVGECCTRSTSCDERRHLLWKCS